MLEAWSGLSPPNGELVVFSFVGAIEPKVLLVVGCVGGREGEGDGEWDRVKVDEAWVEDVWAFGCTVIWIFGEGSED